MFAIGFSGDRPPAAEMKIVVGRVTDRPHAGRAGELEDIAARCRCFLDDPRHQPDPVDLADDRVLADPDAAADLRRRYPFLPEQLQMLNALRCPGRLDARRHIEFRDRLKRPRSIHFLTPYRAADAALPTRYPWVGASF